MLDDRVISMDIGSKNIHIIEGKNDNDGIKVEKAFMLPTPQGSVLDGRLEDEISLKEVIRTALALNKIKTKSVSLVLQSSLVIMKDLVFPEADVVQLNNMVTYEMGQYLPVSAGEYNVEYKIIERLSEENVKKLRIRAAAMPKELSRKYYNFIKSMNLRPAMLDVQFNSLAKLMSSLPLINGKQPGADMTFAVLDMGSRSTGINIISKGKPDFSRLISFGGFDIDTYAANYYTLSFVNAEEKKIKEFTLDGNSHDSADDRLKSVVDQWISEIQKVFQFYKSLSIDSRIDSIYLHGGSSNIKGLPQYIEQLMGIPTCKIETLGNVKIIGNLSDFRMEYFVNAVGAMIKK